MNKQQIQDLVVVLERAAPRGIRLVYRLLDGEAFIVAYEPAETADEAGELPIGFVALGRQGGATVTAVPCPAGTDEAGVRPGCRHDLVGDGGRDPPVHRRSRCGRPGGGVHVRRPLLHRALAPGQRGAPVGVPARVETVLRVDPVTRRSAFDGNARLRAGRARGVQRAGGEHLPDQGELLAGAVGACPPPPTCPPSVRSADSP